MGTWIAIEADARSSRIAEQAIAEAFAAILQVERLMHPTRAGSDIAALAAQPPGKPLRVHGWTWEVLDLSRRLNTASHGIFDPCLASAPGRVRNLDLTRAGEVVAHVTMHLDAGGIAKGYAVDRAIDALRAAGCAGGLVNAGGDLAVFGGRRRRIVCRRPPGADIALWLRNAALATSDTGAAPRPTEHRGYYHGADRQRVVSGSVSVLAGSAAVADALTKCALVDELDRSLLEAFGARVLKMPARPRDRSV